MWPRYNARPEASSTAQAMARTAELSRSGPAVTISSSARARWTMSACMSPIRLPNRWKTVPLPTPAAARAVQADRLLEDRAVLGRLILVP
jgi:hypothetical protein